MNPYIPKRVQEISEYVPDTSCPKIKLDANESPYEVPSRVLNEIEKISLSEMNRYPDPEMKELLSAYGEHICVTPDRLVAGDGSDELISLIINTFLCDGGKLLICAPDFSMYKFYAEFSGAKTVVYEKNDGMWVDFDELKATIERENVRLVMLSNPCNPTGVIYDRETVLKFVDGVKALCVIDEAYMEFAPVGESVIADAEKRDNLIVLKTVSKIGLAGLRCGFATANKELISALKKTKSPYNLNTVTQSAVAAAIRNYSDFAENTEKIKAEVVRMYEALLPLSEKLGFKMDRSSANFVYLRFTSPVNAKTAWQGLRDEGISVRLMKNALRITAGTPSETDALINAFKTMKI